MFSLSTVAIVFVFNNEQGTRDIEHQRSGSLFLVRRLFVRMIGVEPTWIAPLDPKSSASANFATSAKWAAKVRHFSKKRKVMTNNNQVDCRLEQHLPNCKTVRSSFAFRSGLFFVNS